MLLLLTSITVGASNKLNTLVVNYYRYFDHDALHTAWIWQYAPNGGDGVKDHEFQKSTDPESRWLTLEVDLKNDTRYQGSTAVGIIIKRGTGWSGAREPGGDRIIDLSKVSVSNGVGNVYFVQEDVNIYYSISEADTSDKVLDAAFDANNKINIYATLPPTKTLVYSNGVKVQEFGAQTTYHYTITLDQFDINKQYEIELHFGNKVSARYGVSLRNLYSTTIFEDAFHYDGDLGVIYSKEKSIFRLWSPISEQANLLLYHQGHPEFDRNGKANVEKDPYERLQMTNIGKGTWEVEVNGDLAGKYYTFEVAYNNQTHEFVDPYAYSTGANGLRAQVVDFSKTNPKKWSYNSRPNTITNMTDYILYELHVRDLTTHSSWGGNPDHAGTFLGVAESGTSYTDDNGLTVTTGLDHLAELGINAVHFLPIFDFGYIDETKIDDENYMSVHGFNWGYMPYNFNTPEGSYSTNPFDGYVRVKELKEMIQALHNKNIRVVMDVVYNHTGETAGSQFEKSMPGYYFRQNADGSYSNGSGTGNETASERSMFRKYMVDSVKFWATEYNISGFRFDLMALHDVETMNQIRQAVNKIDPTIILYGEPWMGGDSPLDEKIRVDKNNMSKVSDNIASFNDNTRNAIKWDWNKGITELNVLNSIRYGIAGGVMLDYANAQDNVASFHHEPHKIINYVSAHDDETLRDFNYIKNTNDDETLELLQKQSNTFILTSQGIPFLHAGVDFMRSKPVTEADGATSDNRVVKGTSGNSYNLPDTVNQLNWENKAKYYDVYNYYRHLIAFRRIMPSLRLNSPEAIKQRLEFIDPENNKQLMYRIKGDDNTPDIVVVHTNKSFGSFTTDKDYIRITNNMAQADAHGFMKVPKGTKLSLIEFSSLILVEDNGKFNYNPGAQPYNFSTPRSASRNVGLILGITIPIVVLAIAGIVVLITIKKRKSL
jgi:pullulanase